jgi:Zn-finger nucleic acid-binding protein
MALDCPRCRVGTLREIGIGEVLIDRCDTCAGLWFDNDEVSDIAGTEGIGRRAEGLVPPAEDAWQELACPRCPDVALRRLQVERAGAGAAPVVVFRCVSCGGTWLDRGELAGYEDPGLPAHLRAHFG